MQDYRLKVCGYEVVYLARKGKYQFNKRLFKNLIAVQVYIEQKFDEDCVDLGIVKRF